MQTNQATWRMLARKMRDLMPVNAEVTDELQVLLLRLAVRRGQTPRPNVCSYNAARRRGV